MKAEHIKVRLVTDGVEVVADDCELFDYLDDVFTERGLDPDYTREEERNGTRFYILHFGQGVPYEDVTAAIDELTEEEVERICELNN